MRVKGWTKRPSEFPHKSLLTSPNRRRKWPKPPQQPPPYLPLLQTHRRNHLSTTTLLLLHHSPSPSIVAIVKSNPNSTPSLYHPLTHKPFRHRLVDLSSFNPVTVTITTSVHSTSPFNRLLIFPPKLPNPNYEECSLLGLFNGGELWACPPCNVASNDEAWVKLSRSGGGNVDYKFDDIAVFKSKVYAVDQQCRTFVCNVSSFLSCGRITVGKTVIDRPDVPDFGRFGWRKRLVVDGGNLYLVVRTEDEFFKVFYLEGSEWVENEGFEDGDRVLFIGRECYFFMETGEFPGEMYKDCIVFTEGGFPVYGKEGWLFECEDDIGIFYLGDGTFDRDDEDGEYPKIDWLPPDWIIDSRSDPEEGDQKEEIRTSINIESDSNSQDQDDGKMHIESDSNGQDQDDGKMHIESDSNGQDQDDGKMHIESDSNGQDQEDGKMHIESDSNGQDKDDGKMHIESDSNGQDQDDGNMHIESDSKGQDQDDGKMHIESDSNGQDQDDGKMHIESDSNGQDQDDGKIHIESDSNGQDQDDGNMHIESDSKGQDQDDGKMHIESDSKGQDKDDGKMHIESDSNGQDQDDGKMHIESDLNGQDQDDGKMHIESDSNGQDQDDGKMQCDSNSREKENEEMHIDANIEGVASLQGDASPSLFGSESESETETVHTLTASLSVAEEITKALRSLSGENDATDQGILRKSPPLLIPRACTSSTIKSYTSDSATTKFEGFDIRSDLVSTLQNLWQKHGNIIENSSIRSGDMVSRGLESLATVVRILEDNSVQSLTGSQADYLRSTLSDLICIRFKVDWLVPFVEKAVKLHKRKPLLDSLNNLSQLSSKVKERKALVSDELAKLGEEENKLMEEMAKVSSMIPFSGKVKLDEPLGLGLM